jgi:hypothetical protein
MTPEYNFKVQVDPKIIEMDIVTGKIKKEYILDHKHGAVEKLLVSDDYIVYCVSNYLWMIDRFNDVQKKLLRIPICDDELGVNLSFSGQLLNICYGMGYWNGGIATHKLRVFNLPGEEAVKKISYSRYPWHKMLFQDGKLVIIDSISSNRCIYVEDFECINGSKELCEAEPDKWKRTKLPDVRVAEAENRT